jgi:D-3-phosphoglycerate dehydrogenase
VRPYVIAVADGAFADREGLQADFAGLARLRWVDLGRPETIPTLTEDADAVVVTLQRLTRAVISAFSPTVRVIGRAGVGLDTIDLEAAESAGVAVINQPAYGAPEVASHALALLLAVHRRLSISDRYVRAGWSGRLDLDDVQALDEMTLGVLGFGRIGRTFAEYARPLVGEVIYYDPAPIDTPAFARPMSSLEGLLTHSQALSLHLPLMPQTRGLLGRRELNLLPAGAMVVNVARGGILDEEALAEMLVSGRLAGAGLDVFEQEPLPAGYPLLSAPNTVLTPHSASSSIRAVHRLSHWTIEDMIEYLTTGGIRHGSIVVAPRAGAHRT